MLGLGELIGQLREDGRALVRAEISLVKSKASNLLRRSRTAIILFLLAALIAFAALIGLFLGFVLALAPLVGAALAGVIVLVGGILLAGLLGWIGVRLLAGPARPSDVESMT